MKMCVYNKKKNDSWKIAVNQSQSEWVSILYEMDVENSSGSTSHDHLSNKRMNEMAKKKRKTTCKKSLQVKFREWIKQKIVTNLYGANEN